MNPVHANAQAAALTVSQLGATAPTTNADEQTGGAAYSLRAGPGANAAFYIMKYMDMGKDSTEITTEVTFAALRAAHAG